MDVGSQIQLNSESWSFADAWDHFDEHIQQSVPNCQEQREYIAALSRFFLHQNARIYEIGVSTGALAAAILADLPEREIEYIGLDVEASMVDAAQERLQSDPRFRAEQTNVANYVFEDATLVVSYYTLQFIPLKIRQQVLLSIYQALAPGGALIIYEKTNGEGAHIQDMLTQLYFDFKANQGLSPEAILNKAVSLRGISMPLSLEENRQLLLNSGFQTIELIYRAYCFAGYLALKA